MEKADEWNSAFSVIRKTGGTVGMKQNQISFALSVDGEVAQCPIRMMLGYQNGELLWAGELQTQKRQISDILTAFSKETGERYGKYVDELIPALPQAMRLCYNGGMSTLEIVDKTVWMKAAMKKSNAALVFAFDVRTKAEGEASVLVEAANAIGNLFGIQQFYFFGRYGDGILLKNLLPPEERPGVIPSRVDGCSLLLWASLSFEGNGIFAAAVRTLFGMKQAELFIGLEEKGFMGMISIPAFRTAFMESRDLYLQTAVEGSQAEMELHGSFIFSFLPEIVFSVGCALGMKRFYIEAMAEMEKPQPLFGPFSIGDTCLSVGFDGEPTFALFTNLYLRKLHLFGAVMLGISGPLIHPELLSAAVSDFSIPILVENVLGMTFPGLETVDFIRLLGLPFQEMEPFDREMLEQLNGAEIVCRFNSQVRDASLRLEEDQVKVYPFDGGVSLVDQKRMRHYYIRDDGHLQLAAQFYYADVNTRLGSFTIEKGIFVCSTIELFGVQMEALFSFREGEGVLAYARIASIDLGFFKLEPSEAGQASEEPLPIPADSILHQFMGTKQEGAVFFLSAGKRDVTFYLDGRVEFLSFFYFEARVIFCKGYISMDIGFRWMKIFDVSFHLKVDYRSFRTGGFEFRLTIGTAGLAEQLESVQQKIDRAIERCREKIGQATREIDRAQAHVNELYSQIDFLDRKIEQCKQDISSAAWWKRAFVAIAKGLEIGAYEVAKAGVYAAIGVATAALQVAKQAVQLAGVVGESVMKAANAVIQGALTLFYINRLELYGKASMAEQALGASIEFVALGKTYRYETSIQRGALEKNAKEAIAGNISGKMQNDLDNIENGAFSNSRRQYKRENDTISRQCERLVGAREHLASSFDLLKTMEETYIQEFHEPMAEFDQLNQEYLGALDCVEGILKAGKMSGDMGNLSRAMGGLKRSVNARKKKGILRMDDTNDLQQMIREYDEAKLLFDEVKKSIAAVEKKREKMVVYVDSQKERTRTERSSCVMREKQGSMERVLNHTEEMLYKTFPAGRNREDYINLSRETKIHQYLDEARQEFGIHSPQHLQAMRSRSREGMYVERL